MGKINRREFLEDLIATQVADEKAHPHEDVVFKKYANHTLPQGLMKGTGTINQYTGQWTQTEVMHLLRRATFGIRPADIAVLQGMTMSAAVDYLFSNAPAAAPAPPVNNYYNGGYVDPTGVANGATWVNAAYGDGTVNGKRRTSLKSWWTGLILNQNLSILEKMNWFWHNHFSTETQSVGDARMLYIHYAMLRANALGNFKTLVTLVTKDPAMLVYLNGKDNTGASPDENYAREVQELFTVGKYNSPSYTQADVVAAAKVLSGWQIDYTTTPISSKFTASRHAGGNKTFSSFYSNTVIAGQTGAAGANETDAFINMLFGATAQQTATYICQKLYRYFVYYDIDSTIQANIISPLATTLIANNWNIVPVVKQLLKSNHFYDVMSRGCSIRTPLDFYAGIYRTFGITLPNTFDDQKTYSAWNSFRQSAADNGLDLGDPPNVSGMPAYYQTPEYYELWINSNTYPHRLQYSDMMLTTGFSSGGSAIKINVLGFTQSYANASDPDMLVQYFCDLLLGITISAAHMTSLKSILLSGQSTNGYWTSAWNAYVANPNTANTNVVKPRLTSLLTEILRLPEHHLA